jgi:hypothetical protein
VTYNLARIRSASFPSRGLELYRYMNLSDNGFTNPLLLRNEDILLLTLNSFQRIKEFYAQMNRYK